jgi:hypothetical protein
MEPTSVARTRRQQPPLADTPTHRDAQRAPPKIPGARGPHGVSPPYRHLNRANFLQSCARGASSRPSPTLGRIATQRTPRTFASLGALGAFAAEALQAVAPRRTSPQQPPLADTPTHRDALCTPRTFASLCALGAFAAEALQAVAPRRTSPQQPPLAATPTHRDAHCTPKFLGESWRSLAPWRKKRSQPSPPAAPRYTDGEARQQCRTARNAAPRDAFPEQRARPRVRPRSIDLSRSVP